LFLSIGEKGDVVENLEDVWPEDMRPILPPAEEGLIILYFEEIQLATKDILISGHKMSEEENIPLVEKYSIKRDLNFNLVRALIEQESDWNPNENNVNPTSTDWGLIQINDHLQGPLEDVGPGGMCNKYCPDVTKEMIDSELYKTDNEVNIQIGTCYLACLREHYKINNAKSLVAAYNTGPKKLMNCDYEECEIPSSTRNVHVPKIMEYYEKYSGVENG